MTKELEYEVTDETVRGPNEERDIDEGDWRDPDKWLELDGTKVYSRDTAFNTHAPGSAVEPNWDLGWYVMEQDTNKIVMEFKGPCPSPFRESLLEGRDLCGVIIAQDNQMHN